MLTIDEALNSKEESMSDSSGDSEIVTDNRNVNDDNGFTEQERSGDQGENLQLDLNDAANSNLNSTFQSNVGKNLDNNIQQNNGEVVGLVSVTNFSGEVVGSYNTLYEAAVNALDGSTIVLNDDIEMGFFELNGVRTQPTMVIEGKSLTLDGNGHTVTAKNEAFSMIECRETGKITLFDIIMDGSNASNRIYSNIINVEGGEVTIEDGVVLRNNATNAVGIGTNEPGGVFIMNGGEICGGNVTTGGSDTGAAVTVLEGSRFIMNGGSIHDNYSTTGASGIMANRGGEVVINGGEIYNNSNTISRGSAIHIQGGIVTINDVDLHYNGSNYAAIYVTNHSSFDRKWDGVLNVYGGHFYENGRTIYHWSKGSIEGTAAYINVQGAINCEETFIYTTANGFDNLDFKPIRVTSDLTLVNPLVLSIGYEYILGQEVVDYLNEAIAQNTDFISPYDEIGYQVDQDGNYLYVESKRPVVFMDGEVELTDFTYWEFVEDSIDEPQVSKDGYTLDGWYKDPELTDKFDFATDKLPRDNGEFILYSKWIKNPIHEDASESTGDNSSDTSCASTKDRNCDGVVTCEEAMGLGWYWNEALKACVISPSNDCRYQLVNTSDN